MAWKKQEEKDELTEKRVFSIKHSDIPKGVTQCVKHEWVKLNDNELHCPICDTVIICDSDYLNELILR